MISFFLLFSLIASTASFDQVKRFKFPNKPRPFYPIDGEYLAVAGVAVSPLTNEIYFCDEALGQIFKISGDEQYLVAGAGGGPGYKDGHLLAAKFSFPQGISFHPNGTLLAVADTKNHVIRVVDLVKGTVSTLSGTPGKSGLYNGIGSSAKFNSPFDVAFDSSSGEFLYVADSYNNVIRKIHLASGNTTTVAGTKSAMWDYVEGIATKVSLNSPFSILYDPDEMNLYISDSNNHAIRVVNGSGYLQTVMKSNDALKAPFGMVKKGQSLFVADTSNSYILVIDLQSKSWSVYAGSQNLPGFYDGQRRDAQFNSLTYITLTNTRDMVVSDYYNNALRVISDVSGYLYTLLKQRGMGYENGAPAIARFNFAYCIEFDPLRRVLYLADSFNNVIRRVYLDQDYRVNTLAGQPYSGFVDGSFGVALFRNPKYLMMDPNNHDLLYICDTDNKAIRSLNLSAATVTTPWITKSRPASMTADRKGNLYLYLKSHEIYTVPANGISPIHIAGSGTNDCNDGEAMQATIGLGAGMVFYSNLDAIFFSDSYCNKLRSLSLVNLNISTVYGSDSKGFLDGQGLEARFHMPYGLALRDGALYLADNNNNAIRKIGISNGHVSTLSGGPECGYRNGHVTTSLFCMPYSVTVDTKLNDTVYVLDSYNNVIRMIQNDSVTTIVGFGSPIYNATNVKPTTVVSANSIIALDVNQLLISDTINNCIIKVSIGEDAMDLETIAGDGSNGWKDGIGTEAMLNWPSDMALSADRSIVYIADSKNHLIRRLDFSTGRVTTFAGTGVQGNDIKPNLLASSFNDPRGVALDTRSDILYVADSGNNCIKRINGSIITIWAGSVMAGFKNGLSIFAQFARPFGIVYDPESDCIFVADTFNHGVRRIDAKRLVTTIAGINGTSGYVDGSSNIAKFQYPTKVVLGRTKGELLILDSGNHAVRIIDTALQNVSTLVLDIDVAFRGVRADDLGNIYISDSKSVWVFGKSQNYTSIKSESSRTVELILISIVVIILLGTICGLVYWRRRKMVPKTTMDVLNHIGSKKAARNSVKLDQSNTITASKSMAIAIPGYLSMNLENAVRFPDTIKVSGEGGTARIFKAKLTDPKLIEKHGVVDVAVKVFGKNTSKESFLYEVMLMSSLPKSSYLIELIGYSDDGRVLVIIMKDYPMSLRDLLVDKSFPNNTDVNAKISVDIATGMNLIHQKGIVHFDLKPANVLIAFSNGTVNCVICDFGFANFISDVQDKIVKGVKKPTEIGITARYAAPELFAKVNASNSASGLKSKAPVEIEKKIDVYAYAMTLFYVYVREAPWKDLSLDEIERLAIAGERPEIPSTKFDIPKKIEDLIKACWSQDPNERPSFDEILDRLKSI